MFTIAIPYFTGTGHTQKLAEYISEGIAAEGTTHPLLIDVETMVEADWEKLNASHGILFGSPTYMGSIAARYKQFLEETSSSFWIDQVWADKVAGAFTIGSSPSGDKLSTLTALNLFACQHGMIWAGFNHIGSLHTNDGKEINHDGSWLGLMATSSADKSQLIRPGDVDSAHAFGRRFAQVVTRWNR